MRILLSAMILIALCCGTAIAIEADPLLATVPEPASEITAVLVGSHVVYRYQDAQGHTVILDRPPPGYAATKFENLAPPVADAPAAPKPVAERAVRAKRDSIFDIVRRYAVWFVLATLAVLGLVWSSPRVLALGRRFFSRRRTLTSVLDRSGYAAMHGVILPLAGGRTAFFHHIVRTPSGLLVLETQRGEGAVPRRPVVPTPIEPQKKSTPKQQIDTAVAALDARVEAIKALAPGVPVFGRFVCTGREPATVTSRVVTLPMLKASLRMFRERNAADGVTLDTAWHTLLARAGRDEPLAVVPARIGSPQRSV